VGSMAIAWVVFACVFGSALLGLFLHSALPEHHLSADSKDVVKLGIALIATMAALVLSLLIASGQLRPNLDLTAEAGIRVSCSAE